MNRLELELLVNRAVRVVASGEATADFQNWAVAWLSCRGRTIDWKAVNSAKPAEACAREAAIYLTNGNLGLVAEAAEIAIELCR